MLETTCSNYSTTSGSGEETGGAFSQHTAWILLSRLPVYTSLLVPRDARRMYIIYLQRPATTPGYMGRLAQDGTGHFEMHLDQ